MFQTYLAAVKSKKDRDAQMKQNKVQEEAAEVNRQNMEHRELKDIERQRFEAKRK